MKILHLLSSSKYGGAEKVAIDIITSIEQNNEMIYASLEGEIEEILKDRGIKYDLSEKISLKKINQILNLYDIDTIHAHDFRASLLASRFYKRVQVISHIHQYPTWLNHNFDPRFLIYQLNASKFSTIFIASDSILKSKLFKNKKNTKLLTNYVSIKLKNEVHPTKIYDFIFVGRLEKEKNPFSFLEIIVAAQKKNSSIKALVVGDGSLSEEMKKKIKKQNLNVKMLGFVKEPSYFMSQSKYIVNTSPREGFGIASIEAMQVGTPLITYRNGGISQLITDKKNGLIISENEIDINKIITFLNDEEKYNILSEKAKITSEIFNNKAEWIDNILREYDAIKKKIKID